jgi:glycosyltransferase involved in cell wall biosynthesis
MNSIERACSVGCEATIPPSNAAGSPRILIYEPSVGGHHLELLRRVTADLLGAGYRLTLAVDKRPAAWQRLQEQMAEWLPHVRVMPAWGRSGRPGQEKMNLVAECVAEAGADIILINNFDSLASVTLRRAALGLMPPRLLHGRLAGIYTRPVFLARRGWAPNRSMKSLGFARLMNEGWFHHLLLPDPDLLDALRAVYPGAPAFPLMDSFPERFAADRAMARRHFAVPDGKKVGLFFGGAYRRKGLRPVLKAMEGLPDTLPVFLLCVGRERNDTPFASELVQLTVRGRARAFNRYVSPEEVSMAFAAADFVFLTYVNHSGTSGVLAQAAASEKPVITSDQGLLRRWVRQYDLGLQVPQGDVVALSAAITQAVLAPPAQLEAWRQGAKAYAAKCSRAAFRDALLTSFGRVGGPLNTVKATVNSTKALLGV